jgi:hypothetical protein
VASSNSKGYAIYTGDCYTGLHETTCRVGNAAYAVSEVVAWTDAKGVGRGGPDDPGEWPTCLPETTETKDLHFAGSWLPIGPDGLAPTIVWVDCRGR